MWTAIISALSAGLQWGLGLFRAKNTDTEIAAKDAAIESKIDQDNTAAVHKAIETGNLEDLRK